METRKRTYGSNLREKAASEAGMGGSRGGRRRSRKKRWSLLHSGRR